MLQLRICMPKLKIPHSTTKTRCRQINKLKKSLLLTVLPVFCLLYKIVVFHITQSATEILTNILMTKQLETVNQIYSCLVPKLCLTPFDSIDSVCQAPLSMNSPGKNIGEGCHFLLQEIFSTQELNLALLSHLHWQADYFPLNHQGSPGQIYSSI